jgi:hypothetical protein
LPSGIRKKAIDFEGNGTKRKGDQNPTCKGTLKAIDFESKKKSFQRTDEHDFPKLTHLQTIGNFGGNLF